MGTLTDEPEHEVIPSPVGALTDRAKMREYYEMLFNSIGGNPSLYGGERRSTGAAAARSVRRPQRPVSFRLLHVFEFRNGDISREQVWCDLAEIQRQLGATVS